MIRFRFGFRMMLAGFTIAVLLASHFWTSARLHQALAELRRLRSEVGYLNETDASKLVAVPVPTDDPMTWKIRVRTPALQSYQVAYSTRWLSGDVTPQWYSAQMLPTGESLVTFRILHDPRDSRWKVVTLVRHEGNVWRMASELSERQTRIFRQSHDTIRGGIMTEVSVVAGHSIRVVDEKWFTGEGGLMLFGDASPDDDIDGIFAELQPVPSANFQSPLLRR